MKNSQKKGSSELLVIIIFIILAIAAAYWYYKSSYQAVSDNTQVVEMVEISESNDEDAIEADLEATIEGDLDEDFMLFDQDLDGLR